jgi:hypothetical protein
MDVKDGHIYIPSMKLASSVGYMYLTGNQNFDKDMKMNYEMKVPLSLVKQASWNVMKSKIFGKKKQKKTDTTLLADTSSGQIPADDQLVEKEIIDQQKGILKKYITVRVEGTSEDLKFGIGKKKK